MDSIKPVGLVLDIRVVMVALVASCVCDIVVNISFDFGERSATVVIANCVVDVESFVVDVELFVIDLSVVLESVVAGRSIDDTV